MVFRSLTQVSSFEPVETNRKGYDGDGDEDQRVPRRDAVDEGLVANVIVQDRDVFGELKRFDERHQDVHQVADDGDDGRDGDGEVLAASRSTHAKRQETDGV